MNTTFKKVMCGTAMLFMLTGCAKEVTFEDFQKAYKDCDTTAEIEKMKVKGWYMDEEASKKVEVNAELSTSIMGLATMTEEQAVAYGAVIGGTLIGASLLIVEIPGAKYYAGDSFRIECELKDDETGKNSKMKFEYDEHFNPTLMDVSDQMEIKVSYTYKK